MPAATRKGGPSDKTMPLRLRQPCSISFALSSAASSPMGFVFPVPDIGAASGRTRSPTARFCAAEWLKLKRMVIRWLSVNWCVMEAKISAVGWGSGGGLLERAIKSDVTDDRLHVQAGCPRRWCVVREARSGGYRCLNAASAGRFRERSRSAESRQSFRSTRNRVLRSRQEPAISLYFNNSAIPTDHESLSFKCLSAPVHR